MLCDMARPINWVTANQTPAIPERFRMCDPISNILAWLTAPLLSSFSASRPDRFGISAAPFPALTLPSSGESRMEWTIRPESSDPGHRHAALPRR